MGAQCGKQKWCNPRSEDDISSNLTDRGRGPRPLYMEAPELSDTRGASPAVSAQDTSMTTDIMNTEKSIDTSFPFSPNILPKETELSPSSAGCAVVDNVDDDIGQLPRFQSAKSSASRHIIKVQVAETYDVVVSPSSSTPGGGFPVEDKSNLLRKETDRVWSHEDIRKLSAEMESELQHLRTQSADVSVSEILGATSPLKISSSRSQNSKLHSKLHIKHNDDADSFDESQEESFEDSHSTPTASPLDVSSPETIETDTNWKHGKLTNSQIFRMNSAQKWSVDDIESTKNEMAKHLVHLHANMLEAEITELP